MNNRYLKPKEAFCSVCGDKIKVGEKYALGTVRGYKKDPETNQIVCFGTTEEIFCGFCKPTSDEYDTRPERIHEAIKVQDKIRRGKQYYRTDYVCWWLEKHLDFYRNEKEDEE